MHGDHHDHIDEHEHMAGGYRYGNFGFGLGGVLLIVLLVILIVILL